MFYCIQKNLTMKLLIPITIILLFISCNKESKPNITLGTWRGEIEIQGQTLPFGFELDKNDNKTIVRLINSEEKITLDEIYLNEDSIRMVMHIFDSEIHAKISDSAMEGYFVKNYDQQNKFPFHATFGEKYRFIKPTSTTIDFTGKYSLEFQTKTDKYVSVGIFNQSGSEVTGTFLTPTGDYRYLQGNVVGDELKLSTFDGNHAFVFNAHFEGDSIKGDFYSGMTSLETWKGIKNENASMPDSESLTYLKPGYETLDFSFPDPDNKIVTSKDPLYKDKVLILQIFGTWCPNCMDETKFLNHWYSQNKDRGIEILGLAYERKDDFQYASERIKKMKEKLNVGYNFVIAGNYDKAKASETLPALNRILAFPTTIFIGKDGKVKHIHTGFSGPGTGIYYDQFKERFNQIVNELLAENIALSNN
jgi:thiol-disulfide isomerase/thioredoxin